MFLRRHLKANAIGWIAILLVTGSLFGCSEEEPFEPIEPIDPDETNHFPVIASRADTFAIVGDTLRLEFFAADDIPVRDVTVSVYDRRGGSASTTFSISVSMGP